MARSLTDDQGDEAARLYRKGATVSELEKHFGVGRDNVRSALKQRSVKMREPGRRRGNAITGMSYVPRRVQYASSTPDGWDELP